MGELGPHEPPEMLHFAGRELQNESTSVAIVGARHATAAGLEMAETLGRGLAEAGCTVVSGLAVGVDAAAHKGAIDAGGHTVAVLGCGIDVDYPRRNKGLRKTINRVGTLVTEYLPGTPPYPGNFPARNRIIVGLSSAVVVVEGTYKSGALVTARLALDANRAVFAVPGSSRNVMAQGPNELIRTSQAALITGVDHIFEDLAPHLVWRDRVDPIRRSNPVLEEEELEILSVLDDVPMTTDRIARRLGVSAGKAALALSRLEVRGLASRGFMGYSVTGTGAKVRSNAFDEG